MRQMSDRNCNCKKEEGKLLGPRCFTMNEYMSWEDLMYLNWTHKDTNTCAHTQETCELCVWVQKKKNVVPTEQKVHSQGRMLGYLFFSLLSSLLASSYVPLALPPGNDYKNENDSYILHLPYWKTSWLFNCSCALCSAVCKALFSLDVGTSSATYSKQSSIKSRELQLPLCWQTVWIKSYFYA